ncbi:MAG: cupin domain-containing protein [Chloroflexi bacterium]|nr:cupin domain-containing protein [Chloroflexota bacterium]
MTVKLPVKVNREHVRPVQAPDANCVARPPALETTAPPEISVGHRLRGLRDERDLSIRALAGKCGLAMNTLSLIENGRTSPSVSTLQRIARGLDVPITAFFETEGPKNNIAHLKAGQRPRALIAHGVLEDLGAGLTDHAVEPFLVTLEPLAGSGSQVCAHTGYEFVYCLEGRLLYTIEQCAYLLEPGDSLLFESHLPHRWQNVGETQSRNLLAMYPTDARDRPTEQHFSERE